MALPVDLRMFGTQYGSLRPRLRRAVLRLESSVGASLTICDPKLCLKRDVPPLRFIIMEWILSEGPRVLRRNSQSFQMLQNLHPLR